MAHDHLDRRHDDPGAGCGHGVACLGPLADLPHEEEAARQGLHEHPEGGACPAGAPHPDAASQGDRDPAARARRAGKAAPAAHGRGRGEVPEPHPGLPRTAAQWDLESRG